MRRVSLILALCASLAAGGSAAARDLGAYGATFKVIEQDLLEVLKARLLAAQKSGKIEALNKAFAARVKKNIERPPPVAGIAHTSTPKTWLVDPSITVPRDFADQKGRVFARQGEVINPLDRLPNFNRVLVFVDGDSPEQLKFAFRRAKRAPEREKVYIVLTSGAPLEVMRRERVEVFFDQGGNLTSHFGVTQVPAVVEREGRALRVSEVRP